MQIDLVHAGRQWLVATGVASALVPIAILSSISRIFGENRNNEGNTMQMKQQEPVSAPGAYAAWQAAARKLLEAQPVVKNRVQDTH